MLSFVVAPKVKFAVDGEETGADGTIKPFSFDLVGKRLSVEELEAYTKGEQATLTLRDFLVENIEDWDRVRDDHNQPVQFNADNFRQVLTRPGMVTLALRKYQAAIQARAKN